MLKPAVAKRKTLACLGEALLNAKTRPDIAANFVLDIV